MITPTKEQALEALEDLDDFSRMECGVEPIGAYNCLSSYIQSTDTSPSTFKMPPPVIQFNDDKGNTIGVLEIVEGELKFSGNADESAIIFFELICSMFKTS